jgi:RHS repeat-associated protein
MEVEAWGYDTANLNWLVTDQLGTPRMVFDQGGALANVKRHDYLPFGEELLGGTGGRTSAQGYDAADGVRQKFTSKERDIETGLDYFLARYYSSTQGRFTSPDEFRGGPKELFVLGSGDPKKQALPYAELTEPQSLNKYQYCYNNPLRYIDPDGHKIRYIDGQTDDERREARGRLMADLAQNERKYFTIKYDKSTHAYTLALKGNVDKALSQNHTAAFGHLVETIRATATLRLGIADTVSTRTGATYSTVLGGGGMTVGADISKSRDVEVYVSREGNPEGVQGKTGGMISDPKSIIEAHEVLGHGRLRLLGLPHGQHEAIEVENEIRRGRGLPERANP